MKKISIIALIFTVLSCGKRAKGVQSATTSVQTSPIANYGNGVYNFNCIDEGFGSALKKFIVDNPKLRVVTISDTGGFGEAQKSGFWVITEPRDGLVAANYTETVDGKIIIKESVEGRDIVANPNDRVLVQPKK